MLEVKNLYLKAGSFELGEITFKVERGEHLTVLGPSGSGKTTLLETLAGFRKPRRGRILLNGRDITDLPPERRGFAVVYQDYLLFPHLTVFENIAFGLRKRKMPALRREVLRIAEELGIDHLLDKKPNLLSGGEKQRIAIARALVVKPELLLMDEPFSALDVETKGKLRTLIGEVVKRHSTTVVHITHDPTDALELADKVLFLKGGKMLEYSPTQWFFNCPQNPEVERFVETNTLVGTVERTTPKGVWVKVGNTRLLAKNLKKVPSKERVKVCFRPETVAFKKGTTNTLRVKLEKLTPKGFFYEALLSLGGKTLKATVPPWGVDFLKVPSEVDIFLPPSGLFVSPL